MISANYFRLILVLSACAVGALFALPATAKLPETPRHRIHEIPAVPDQLLVQYKSGFRADFIEARLSNMGLTRLAQFEAINMDLLQIPRGYDLGNMADLVGRESMVALVEPNFIYREELRPNDPNFSNQWHLENTGGNYLGSSGPGIPGADLNIVAAWDIESAGAGSVIAVIDDAVDVDHQDLAPNIRPGGKCFDSNSGHCGGNPNNPNPTGEDQDHGTEVAGAAAARGDNALHGASPAWNAGILPYKTDLTNAAITAAINDAVTSGAHIINMSFGGPTPSASTRAALAAAQTAGVLAITSAGNSDANNDRSDAHYPSGYDLPNVIAVAASDGYDDISGFSQWGSFGVELAAPGSLIRTTAVNNSFRAVSGTSFASPLVAGVAALVKAHTGASGPNAWKRLRAHLLYGGINGKGLGSGLTPGRDRKSVPGRVQAGRLDAERALQGPPGGVLVIRGVSIDDSASGNGNGLLDPNENADLVIEVENVWTAESNVAGTLVPFDSSTFPSTFETGQLAVLEPGQSFGTIAQDQVAVARFPVSLGSVTQNEHYFLTLELASDNGTLPDRYFMLEVGTLANNVQVTQTIQRLNFDEFHAWHIDVPPGASNLLITTTADNPSNGTCTSDGTSYPASIDIDLLVRFDRPPQYSIALDPPEGSESFYVDPNTEVDGNCGGHERFFEANPQSGTWHIVVVNFDQVRHDYTLVASFDAPQEGSIFLDRSQYTVDEAAGLVSLSVTRTGGSGAVSVDYTTRNGAAVAGSDYSATSGTLNWGDGETGSKSFQINITNDSDFEADEQFFADLSNATNGANLGTPASATITIVDDDNPGELALSEAEYRVDENGLVAFIGVTRSNGSKGILTVDYATADGTATAGADYQPAAGSLTWADGEAGEKSFQVNIIEDPLFEPDESVILSITNANPGVPITRADAVLTIDDNDDPGGVSFDSGTYTIDEAGSSLQLSVSRSGGDLAGAASVEYGTTDLSASAGSDYTAASGTLNWMPGEGGPKTINIAVSDDSVNEGDETFSVILSNPSPGLALNDPSSATVTITDDDDPGQLQFATASISVNEGSGSVSLTVLRSQGSKGAISVNYATVSGSAVSGSDFQATNGQLSWPDGDTSDRTISVNITNDSADESSETFTISLSSPSNGSRLGSPSNATVTIIDNDVASGGGGGGGGTLGYWSLLVLSMGVFRRRRD